MEVAEYNGHKLSNGAYAYIVYNRLTGRDISVDYTKGLTTTFIMDCYLCFRANADETISYPRDVRKITNEIDIADLSNIDSQFWSVLIEMITGKKKEELMKRLKAQEEK